MVEEVDWFRVLMDLRYQKISFQRIANEIGVSRTAVGLWLSRSTPSHFNGEKLLAMWKLKTGEQEPPRIPRARARLR